ncbi:MAG TPA: hypothetical protein VM053_04595 [Gemmatimonadaceae bacterium]|nr:hypothetical protein [Gemmatimonadaceae bacterium]
MTRIRTISAAVLFLSLAGTGVASGQGKGDKQPKAPKEQKAAPTPHAEKPHPAPHVAKVHVAKPAAVHHVKATPVHVTKPVKVVHIQKVKPAPAAHLVKRELVVARIDQQKRLKQEQQQYNQYRKYLDQQNKLAVQYQNKVLKENRKAQLRFLKQYYSRLAQQQRQMLAARDYSRDPYITSPYVYQYAVAGSPRYTNQYGADVLKQAVNYGYQEGYQAGQADKQDGWAANYSSSYAYRDANYGYTGNYVSQSDYNYYFRQGFQKGYSDGYYARSQYGTNSLTGSQSILGTVLSTILGLTNLR